jgi:DNA-binding PadR family transcriptional regulator
MDQHIKKVYMTMTETAFYILFCLQKPNHGYGIVQIVEKMTEGAIRLAPGTMYGSLSKMEKDGVIRFVKEEDKRKIYEITELGLEILNVEINRIKNLYKITQEEI